MAYGITGVQIDAGSTGVTGRKSGSTFAYIPVTGRDIRRDDETVYGRSGGFKREAERERAS